MTPSSSSKIRSPQQEAIRLARQVGAATEPAQALRAIAALRGCLDALEAQHVDAALAAGSSWRVIAEALGVTRQAAHRKHTARLVAAAQAQARAESVSGNRLVIVAAARVAVVMARQEAAGAQSPNVGTEHLLAGLVRAARRGGGPGADHARGHAGQGAPLRPGERRPRARPPRTADHAVAGAAAKAQLPFSRRGREALEQALREAVRLGNDHLGVEHLLLALLRDGESRAVECLRRLRVTPAMVEEDSSATHRAPCGVKAWPNGQVADGLRSRAPTVAIAIAMAPARPRGAGGRGPSRRADAGDAQSSSRPAGRAQPRDPATPATPSRTGPVGVQAGEGCVAEGPTVALCTVTANEFGDQWELGDDDDRLTLNGAPSGVAEGSSVLDGWGNDVVPAARARTPCSTARPRPPLGRGGDDFSAGGAATCRAGPAPTPSATTRRWGPRRGGVRADLDGRADDGSAGERDRIRTDVENLDGTDFSDVLRRNGRANEIDGVGGADRSSASPSTTSSPRPPRRSSTPAPTTASRAAASCARAAAGSTGSPRAGWPWSPP